MRLVLTITALLCLLTSCDNDPASPDTPSAKGVISGNVIVYDETLTEVSDHSGVTVTYVDVHGRTFTGTTQPDGVWKIELPYGVYRLVSIAKPGYTHLNAGSGKQTPLTGHLDWLGLGERQVIFNTRLMPTTLDTTSEILSVDVQVDTTYTPATDDGNGHGTPATYRVAFLASATVKYGQCTHRLEGVFLDNNGQRIGQTYIDFRGTTDTTLTISITEDEYIKNFDLLKGATLDITIKSSVDIYSLSGDAEGAKSVEHEKRDLNGRRLTVPIPF